MNEKFNYINMGEITNQEAAQRNQVDQSKFKIDEKQVEASNIIIVSDFFENQVTGGAEKTLQALIDCAPFRVALVNSHVVTMDFIQKQSRKFWIFANIANLDKDIVATAMANLNYSAIMFDFIYCKYRLQEKHKYAEGIDCNCHESIIGKLYLSFLANAKSLWFMSEAQAERYFSVMPALRNVDHTVLSSVFDNEFFKQSMILNAKRKQNGHNNKYIIMGSDSWIKGVEDSIDYAEEHGLEYEMVRGLDYSSLLKKLSESKGIIFLPRGGDTCPRFVIEAKILGCETILNDNVMHKNEEWFATDNMADTLSYLYQTRNLFWNGIKMDYEYVPTVSGYITVYNCVENDYPFLESIESLSNCCDEVIVVDAGSTDVTLDVLKEHFKNNEKVKIHQKIIDKANPRWAVEIDGHLKAYARSLCKMQFCLQLDSDEVIHESDYDRFKYFAKYFPRGVELLCFPVIEYWGDSNRVRADIHPWKWRFSRNSAYITHGIPAKLRMYDSDGNVYPEPVKSDSCDYIFAHNYQVVPAANFYDINIENMRQNYPYQYEIWFNAIIDQLPSVHHYSWFNLERKIRHHKNHWSKFHKSMYNVSTEDLAENNTMFDKPWSEVTDEDIKGKAEQLKKIGPRVFHGKMSEIVGKTIRINKTHPAIMKSWMERNSK